ncbi:MAG: MoaD/ThiS family protein [Planctomycetaceae bacterium]|nr:MoaD/ThiS family protein [Planctomycetaceae bacterium]
MPRVCFTPNLLKLIDVRECNVPGSTIGEVLAEVFAAQPELQSYILDEQKRVRRHINLFLNGELVRGTDPLETAIETDAEIYVMQALSGG